MAESKRAEDYPFISYTKETYDEKTMTARSVSFYTMMDKRRTVRDFRSRPIPREVIENIILTAGTAPSGAHKQPWTFCVVTDAAIKQQIRIAAEKEEYESYHNRMPEDWLSELAPLGTDWHKPFLETAPVLIVVFKKNAEVNSEGKKSNTYYAVESIGVACGFLLAAIHYAGLATLTHTPSPMNFLSKILQRPEIEKPFLLIPVGYIADECRVPDITRKKLTDIIKWY